MRVAMAALLVTGCSFFATSGPKAPEVPDDCNDSYWAPVTDAMLTVVLGAASVSLIGGDGFLEDPMGKLLMVPAVLYGLSAVVGFPTVSECSDAHARARKAEREQRRLRRGI